MYVANVDFVITTFERPDCLARLLKSIRRYGYKNHIIVADQSREHYAHKYADSNTTVLKLPFDCGLSAARNKLMAHSREKFVLLLEDDFEFTPKTNIELMKTLFATGHHVGVVGGQVEQLGTPIPFEFLPTVVDGVLYHTPDGDKWRAHRNVKYKRTGCVMNFALFNRKVFRDVTWDRELKLREHQDFYLRLADTRWTVVFTPEISISDSQPRHYSDEYKQFKQRDEFLVKMMKKHGLTKIKYQNGHCITIENGKIVRTDEPPI